MNSISAQSLNNQKFKRGFGVYKKTYKRVISPFKEQFPVTPVPDRPWELFVQDQILAALE